jgi:hypothetical protein
MKTLVLPAGYYVIDCRVDLIIYICDGSNSVGSIIMISLGRIMPTSIGYPS